MKKIHLLLSLLLSISLGTFVFFLSITGFFDSNLNVSANSSKSNIPVRLIVPRMGINSKIEPVGIDNEGNMANPKYEQNIGWYMFGARPGERGSVVLSGHVDASNGATGVFYGINSLLKGDEIRVVDENEKVFEYKVVYIKTYEYDRLPMKLIFEQEDKKVLRLITCTGVYDEELRTYKERIVVFAQLEGGLFDNIF